MVNKVYIESISFKHKDEEYTLEEIETKYLFPYFFRFDNHNDSKLLESGITTLSGNSLIEFRNYIFQALNELLLDCYDEPPIKKRQKHPTFFEKFIIDNKKYVVDYTTSTLGRLLYTLYLRFSFIEKAIESGSELIVIKK